MPSKSANVKNESVYEEPASSSTSVVVWERLAAQEDGFVRTIHGQDSLVIPPSEQKASGVVMWVEHGALYRVVGNQRLPADVLGDIAETMRDA